MVKLYFEDCILRGYFFILNYLTEGDLEGVKIFYMKNG